MYYIKIKHRVGFCPGGVLSGWGFVRVGLCPGGVMSGWGYVRVGFCPFTPLPTCLHYNTTLKPIHSKLERSSSYLFASLPSFSTCTCLFLRYHLLMHFLLFSTFHKYASSS